MVLAGIVMDRDARMVVQPGVDQLLLLFQDKMVGAGDVEHERPGDGVLLAKDVLEADAVIADAGVDIGPRGGHVGKPAAEAVADTADLPAAGQTARLADRRLDVANALV